MAEALFQPRRDCVPELEVGVQVDVGLPGPIGHRQAAAGADRRERAADFAGGALHRPADLAKMLQVGARADVHVQTCDFQALGIGPAQAVGNCSCQMPCFDCSPPVLVFWLWPWPKPGLIRSVIVAARGTLAELLDHVGRAAIDVDAVLDDQVERLAIENIGRVDDRRRIARGTGNSRPPAPGGLRRR